MEKIANTLSFGALALGAGFFALGDKQIESIGKAADETYESVAQATEEGFDSIGPASREAASSLKDFVAGIGERKAEGVNDQESEMTESSAMVAPKNLPDAPAVEHEFSSQLLIPYRSTIIEGKRSFAPNPKGEQALAFVIKDLRFQPIGNSDGLFVENVHLVGLIRRNWKDSDLYDVSIANYNGELSLEGKLPVLYHDFKGFRELGFKPKERPRFTGYRYKGKAYTYEDLTNIANEIDAIRTKLSGNRPRIPTRNPLDDRSAIGTLCDHLRYTWNVRPNEGTNTFQFPPKKGLSYIEFNFRETRINSNAYVSISAIDAKSEILEQKIQSLLGQLQESRRLLKKADFPE